jgi:hypothetical protein
MAGEKLDRGSNYMVPTGFAPIKYLSFDRIITSVTNGSRLPGCGLGLEPDWMVQFGLLPGKQGYPPGLGTGWNWTAVPFYGSYNFDSN